MMYPVLSRCNLYRRKEEVVAHPKPARIEMGEVTSFNQRPLVITKLPCQLNEVEMKVMMMRQTNTSFRRQRSTILRTPMKGNGPDRASDSRAMTLMILRRLSAI